MSIPDFQSIMLPLLEFASNGKEHKLSDAISSLAIHFNLSDPERRELLPSGKQARFDNRVGWAGTYLKKAGLLTYPARGKFQITQRGLDLLAQKPPRIDIKYLKQFPEYLDFIDGAQLAEYAIEVNLGVSVVSEYQIKRLDLDYFDGE